MDMKMWLMLAVLLLVGYAVGRKYPLGLPYLG